MNRLHRLATAGVIAFAVFVCPEPASAQLVVFDPNNYAQNVLTAARALQQINNQIVSLQNQAQMLINQAKNLATLPFSSLLQLEQSIQRTQQLLAQAQRKRASGCHTPPIIAQTFEDSNLAAAAKLTRRTLRHRVCSCLHPPGLALRPAVSAAF